MSVLFIANVGNRDVQVPGQEELPHPARLLGEALLADWNRWQGRVELPILGKALRWVARQHGQVDRVVLVASDQTDAQFRQSDTAPLADVIVRMLSEHPDWRKTVASNGVHIAPIAGNPSDYDVMMQLYDGLMQTLAAEPFERVYLELSGGTPAMASMLLLKGIERFGARAQPLYVNPAYAMPLSLNVGRQLILDTVVDDLRRSLNVYQYPAALALLDANQPVLQEAWPNFGAIRALVDFARLRISFNFENAEKALFGSERALPPALSRRVRDLANDIADRTEIWLLRETLHTANISFATGAYADFLGRAFRLSEGLSDLVVQQWASPGLFTGEGKDQRISNRWLDQHVDAWEFLEGRNINFNLGVTRLTLLTLAEFFAGQDSGRLRIVRLLKRLNELGSYRNQMPFAHGYAGASRESLKQRYGGKRDDEMQRDLNWLFEAVTHEKPGPNPYEAINNLVLDLIAGGA